MGWLRLLVLVDIYGAGFASWIRLLALTNLRGSHIQIGNKVNSEKLLFKLKRRHDTMTGVDLGFGARSLSAFTNVDGAETSN